MNQSANIPAKGKIGSLRYLLRYLYPYRKLTAGAAIALVMTSSVVLGMGTAPALPHRSGHS